MLSERCTKIDKGVLFASDSKVASKPSVFYRQIIIPASDYASVIYELIHKIRYMGIAILRRLDAQSLKPPRNTSPRHHHDG